MFLLFFCLKNKYLCTLFDALEPNYQFVYREGLRGVHGKTRARHVPHGLEHL